MPDKKESQPRALNAPRLIAIILLFCVMGWLAWSFTDGGIIADLVNPDLSSQEKLTAVQDFFNAWGPLAPVVYVLVVVVEVVVAPIPGTLLYLPGGVIFGGFWGGLLSLIGNVIGAGVSCTLMRSLAGRKATQTFFGKQALEKYRLTIEKHGTAIIALLRVNPLTSSDIVSYAAGLTPIRIWKVMVGTCLGMAPLCFLQSYLSQELFSTLPWLIWPMILLCIAYAVGAITVLAKLRHKNQATELTRTS